jgi:quercetin dioxygenase-like cupin family protein
VKLKGALAFIVMVMFCAAQTDTIIRKPLLLAEIEGGKLVTHVDVREIEFGPHQKTPLHLHPVPVTTYIVFGTIRVQIDGQSEKTLHAGDTFFEPAQVRVRKFENASDSPAKFIATYLLGKKDTDLIKNLRE